MAELEAAAAERNTENLETRLAALEAEKERERAAADAGQRVGRAPGYDFTWGVSELAREKAEAIEAGEADTAASRIEKFREAHADVGRASALLERELRRDEAKTGAQENRTE